VAVVATYVLAVAAASQHVANQLVKMSIDVSIVQRLQLWLHDLLGMGASFLPLIAVALLIGFLVAGLFARKWPGAKLSLMLLAGFIAIVTLHIALNLSFGLHPIPATRFFSGLLIQGLCGGLGGGLFRLVSRSRLG